MLIYKEPFPMLDPTPETLALGTFDGLHEGHRAVIGAAVDDAKANYGLAAVWCFSEPPRNVLSPGSAEPLMERNVKVYSIASLGAEIIIATDPTPELLIMNPKDFAEAIALSISPRTVYCGYNFTFGKKAKGTPELLKKYLSEFDINVKIIPPVKGEDGTPISSTLLRKRLGKKH